MKTFFPLIWDSTQLSEAKSCQMSFFRRHIQHLLGRESIDLIAGGAFAKGIEITRIYYYQHGFSSSEALSEGIAALCEEYMSRDISFEKPAKSMERMCLALESYFDEYSLDYDQVQPIKCIDGKYSLEYNIMLPITDLSGEPILHPTLNVPLLFNGRFDMLATFGNDIWGVDEKTTGSYFTNLWAKSWDMRDQFSAYCWLGQQSGIPELVNLNKFIIRGVSLPTTSATKEDSITKFYSDISNIKHLQAMTPRPQFMIDSWRTSMIETILSMKEKYLNLLSESKGKEPWRYFMRSGGSACTPYRGVCYFMDSCTSEDGEENFLEMEEQMIWRPDLICRQPLEDFLNNLDSGEL